MILTECPGGRIPANRHLSRALHLLLALALAMLALHSPARTGDAQQPVDVQADRSEYDEQRGVQTLVGNVEITQGSMRIEADRIDVFLENNTLSRIEGAGSPIVFTQQTDAGDTIRGEARRLEFDAVAGTLVLVGGATLSQPRQRLSSDRIVFDSSRQRVSAEGGDEGRVNIRIEPPADLRERVTGSDN